MRTKSKAPENKTELNYNSRRSVKLFTLSENRGIESCGVVHLIWSLSLMAQNDCKINRERIHLPASPRFVSPLCKVMAVFRFCYTPSSFALPSVRETNHFVRFEKSQTIQFPVARFLRLIVFHSASDISSERAKPKKRKKNSVFD